MEAVEFFNELNRMCKKYSTDNGCDSSCPLYVLEHLDYGMNEYGHNKIAMFEIMKNTPDKLVAIVDKWSKQNQ